MFQDLHFYVDFDEDACLEDFEGYIHAIGKLIGLVYQHRSTVFYSKNQIAILKECLGFDEYFSQSKGNMLSIVLENASGKIGSNFLFEVFFANESTCIKHVNDSAMSIIQSHPRNALLSLSKKDSNTLLCIKSAEDFEPIKYRVLRDAESLLHWIQDNAPKRVFNLSPKHGKNGQGNWNGESPLLCDEAHAQVMLNSAVPDFNKKANRLFNFDQDYGTFIEFFYEGNNPQNQWHGFHISIEQWTDRVPNSILKFFSKI